MEWADSGEGYTPVVRNKDTGSDTATSDDISTVKKEIISMCTKLGGTKNEELMNTLKSYVPSGNPNAFRDIEKARECLEKIKTIKPVEA